MSSRRTFLLNSLAAAAFAPLASLRLAADAASTAAAAEKSFMQGRRFLAADYSAAKVHIVEPDGKISWTLPAREANDLWLLRGGSVLVTKGNGVKEVAIDSGAVKFDYTTKAEVYATQRLPDGNTFVGECSSGRLLIIAPDGKTIVRETPLLAAQTTAKRPFPGGHGFMRAARVLPNGNFLVSRFGGGEAAEIAPDGKVVWSVKVPGGVHSVARAANGHTYVSAADFNIGRGKDRHKNPAFYEFDAAGKIVWSVSNADLPTRPLRFVGGFQILPNGNALLCNWVGHGHFGKAPHLLEITRSKKIVWQYNDHKQFRTISNVQIFDKGNEPLEGTH
jgi:hypothetical protein